ncbi:right-handed parallel beta-helix repeat-containing protein [Saccharicrinis sp. FJH54]|uniref:right-handed parallel beta-helix repeat-containing protein n=1 Tax=Saccharicrinis sp. FJH54 TaxID=3344665 RepID=UPI0035D4542D
MQRTLYLSLFTFFLTINSFATNYYISSSGGSNNNDGLSPETAWETLSKINSYSFDGGDSILFKRGDTWVGESIKIPRDSLNFSAYGFGAKPVFDGNNSVDMLVNLGNWMDYLSFSYIKFTGATSGAIKDPWISTTSNIIVDSCDFINNSGAAIYLINRKNVRISNNYFTDNRNPIIFELKLDTDHLPPGEGAGDSIWIFNNTIYDNGVTGISLYSNYKWHQAIRYVEIYNNVSTHNTAGLYIQGVYDSKIYNNIFSNNTKTNFETYGVGWASSSRCEFYNNVIQNNGNAGIDVFGDNDIYYYHCDSNLFYNNIFSGHADVCAFRFGGTTDGHYGNKVYNNLFYDNKTHIVSNSVSGGDPVTHCSNIFFNNTLFNSSSYSVVDGTKGKNKFLNNIISGNKGSYAVDAYHNDSLQLYNNIIYSQTPTNVGYVDSALMTYEDFAAITNNTIYADPLFIDTLFNNFRLKQGSPAINAGADIGLTRDFFGKVRDGLPDIGAIEYETAYVPPAKDTFVVRFNPGWNYFSFRVVPGNMNFNFVFDTLTNDNLVKIMDQEGNAIEYLSDEEGWVNNIGELSVTQGYKIKVAKTCDFTTVGLPVEGNLSVNLSEGWNILPYNKLSPQDALTVLKALRDKGCLVEVRDDAANRLYYDSTSGWVNNIGNFIPGKAYDIKVNRDCEFVLLR